jgi:hypothetical protein
MDRARPDGRDVRERVALGELRSEETVGGPSQSRRGRLLQQEGRFTRSAWSNIEPRSPRHREQMASCRNFTGPYPPLEVAVLC